jgi:hypothetical protein
MSGTDTIRIVIFFRLFQVEKTNELVVTAKINKYFCGPGYRLSQARYGSQAASLTMLFYDNNFKNRQRVVNSWRTTLIQWFPLKKFHLLTDINNIKRT